MSAQDNIEKMIEVYRAYGEGNAEPLCQLFAPDGQLRHVVPQDVYAFAKPQRGPDGARAAIALIGEDYEWLTFRGLETIAEGDTVFSITGGRIRHKASGNEAVLHLADFVRFREGRVREYVQFFDSAGAYDWQQGLGVPACAHMNMANKAIVNDAAEAERNKRALAGVYASYQEHDVNPFLGLFADDASYNSVASVKDFRFAGPSQGRAAIVESLGRIAVDYSLIKYDIFEMVAQHDLVAVHADVAFRQRNTGKIARTEKADVFRMRGGKILEFNEFFDTLTARAASEAD